MYKGKVEILFYMPRNLHSKVFLVDKSHFIVGSSNFDYRSFRFMHEINLYGKEKRIVRLLEDHISETIADCIPFDFEKWQNRALIQRTFERLLIPLRHFF
jgi:cardiolipin synthase